MVAEIHLPGRLSELVHTSAWLQPRSSANPSLRLDGRVTRLRILEVPVGVTEEHLALLLNARIWEGEVSAVPLIFSSSLRQATRQWLEERETSYLDAKGHLHVVAPGVLIHIEGARASHATARPSSASRIVLGVHGVRTIQVLLEEQDAVSVSDVAKRASVSMGQAHKVLTQLEHLDLVHTSGKGPGKRRTVRGRAELLDWLARQPGATRWEPSLDVSFYARRPEELWSRVSTTLSQAKIHHAFTGAAAASLYGVGPTSVPMSVLRISPEVSLRHAAEQLGAEVTQRGPNLTLLQDTGKVGCWHAMTQDGVQTAPWVRIYLDILSERRGEDIAQQFREVILGY